MSKSYKIEVLTEKRSMIVEQIRVTQSIIEFNALKLEELKTDLVSVDTKIEQENLNLAIND